MRWRTQKEVVAGKGQFACGSVKCDCDQGLNSFEVNFGYLESVHHADGSTTKEKKNALVKLRLCMECAYKLNYRKIQEKKRIKLEEKAEDQEDGVSKEEPVETKEEEEPTESKNERDQELDNDPSRIWSQEAPTEESAELSRDQEFDAYFADLLK